MAASRPTINNRQARWLLLHRQGLGGWPRLAPVPAHEPRAGSRRTHRAAQDKAALRELIERIGFVQVDSIRTVERAHHMILFARQPRYRPELLAALLEQDGTLFENWTHDASIIPSDFFPYWRHRFSREHERLLTRWRKYRPRGIADVDKVLARVRTHGEVRARDLAPSAPAPPNNGMAWGDWHPSKAALEYLWRTGELAVARREGFEKVYDLTERVLPARFHAREHVNGEVEVVDWAMNAALDRLGLGSSGELAAFFDLITTARAKAWVAARITTDTGAARRITDGTALIEVQVQCDRARDRLSVKALWWEPGVRPSRARQRRLAAELERLRRFTGVAAVSFENGYLRSAA